VTDYVGQRWPGTWLRAGAKLGGDVGGAKHALGVVDQYGNTVHHLIRGAAAQASQHVAGNAERAPAPWATQQGKQGVGQGSLRWLVHAASARFLNFILAIVWQSRPFVIGFVSN